MKKTCFLKFILPVLIIIIFASPCLAKNNANVLKKVSLQRSSNNELSLNIETKKKFTTKLMLFEKEKHVYFVSLPETVYSGPQKLNVSDFKDNISDLTVEFEGSEIDKDTGYTKITVYTKDNTVLTLKEAVTTPAWLYLLVFIFAISILTVISYFCFKLFNVFNYNKLSLKSFNPKNKNEKEISELLAYTQNSKIADNEDTNTDDIQKESNENEYSEILQEEDSVEQNEHDNENNEFDYDEEDSPTPQETLEKMFPQNENNIVMNDDEFNAEPENEETETMFTDENEIVDDNAVTEEKTDFIIEKNENEEDELMFSNSEVVDDTLINDEITDENQNSIIVEENLQEENELMFPNPDEIVDDILTNNDVMDEISDSIMEENEDKINEDILSDSISDNFEDIEPTQMEDNDFNFEQFEDTNNKKEQEIAQEENENNDYTSNSIPIVSGGAVFEPKTFDLSFASETADETQEEDIPPEIIEDNEEKNEEVGMPEELTFDNYLFDSVLGGIPTEEDILLDKIEADEVFVIDGNENLLQTDETSIDLADLEISEPEEHLEDIEKNITEPDIISEVTENIEVENETIENNQESYDEQPTEQNINTTETFSVESENQEDKQESEEEVIAFKFELPTEYAPKNESLENSQNISTDTFFTEDTPEYDEKYFADTKEEDLSLFFKETEPAKVNKPQQEYIDDSEPVILDQKELKEGQLLYLLRHNGAFSLVGTKESEVFVINKFTTVPSQSNIILKHNETRGEQEIYIAKVGDWRALIAVDNEKMENILTLS